MLNKSHSPGSSPEQKPAKGHTKANFWLIRRVYKPSKIYRGNFSVKTNTSLKRMD
jgi:hypothetical protein